MCEHFSIRLTAMALQQTVFFVTLLKIIVADGTFENITQGVDLKSIQELLSQGYDQLKGMEALMQGVKAVGSAVGDAGANIGGRAGAAYRRSGQQQQRLTSPRPAGEKTCCTQNGCMTCPFPAIPMQFYPIPAPAPMPYAVPVRTVFEPVVHDHPSPRKIQEIISKNKDRPRNKASSSTSSSQECSGDEDSSSGDAESSREVDYYADIPIRVKGKYKIRRHYRHKASRGPPLPRKTVISIEIY